MAPRFDERLEPASRVGALVEVGWIALCAAAFGAIAVSDSLIVDVDPSTGTVVRSVAVGVPLGVVLVAVSAGSERLRRLRTREPGHRSAFVLGATAGLYLLFQFVPDVTVLVTLSACLGAIPTRLAVHYRNRRE